MEGTLGKYDAIQVITENDLVGLYLNLMGQYRHLKWWKTPLKKHEILVAAIVAYELLAWIQDGKSVSIGSK